MTNNQLLKKLSEDMKMRNFSHCTYDTYMGTFGDGLKNHLQINRYLGKRSTKNEKTLKTALL